MPEMAEIHFGVYNGPIRFEDHETDLIELFDLDELIRELENRPKKYTNDLKILFPKYEKQLKEFIAYIRKHGKNQ